MDEPRWISQNQLIYKDITVDTNFTKMQKEKSDKMNLYKKMNRHLLSEKVTRLFNLEKCLESATVGAL